MQEVPIMASECKTLVLAVDCANERVVLEEELPQMESLMPYIKGTIKAFEAEPGYVGHKLVTSPDQYDEKVADLLSK